MHHIIKAETSFTVEYCTVCGVAFAMTLGYDAQRVQDNKTFWCPNGHGQHYLTDDEKRAADAAKDKSSYRNDDDDDNAGEGWKKPQQAAQPSPDREAQQKKIRELHELEQAEARNADKTAQQTPPAAPTTATGIPPIAGAAELVAAGHYRKDGRFIRCNHCEKYYSSEAWLSRHLRDRHNINIEGKA